MDSDKTAKDDMDENKRETILYFGNEWGADNRTSSHHIAKRLMRDNKLIYIECPGLRAPQLTIRDVKKVFNKVFQIFKKKRVINSESFVKTLYQIPFHGVPFLKTINKHLLVWQVKKIYKVNNLVDPVLWFVVPHVSYIVDEVKSKCRVYYCVDDYIELPGVNKKLITYLDNKISTLCDVLFVTSEPLYEKKKSYGDKVFLSKHGVDYEHFNAVISQDLETPDDVKDIKGPVIGFFGLIEEWIDLDLIEYLAKKRKDLCFLFIGRTAVDVTKLAELDNVRFIGSVDYEVLPAYSHVFDVGLIPVKTNELIRNFNPLKLREYLAMGLPVVSVYFPEIDEFDKYVYVSNEYDEFLEKIDIALNNNSIDNKNERASSVESSSWENRYKRVIDIVKKKINS